MVMSKYTVDEFLNKELKDSMYYKRLSDQEVQEKLDKYNITVEPVLPHFKHQARCLLAGLENNSFMFLLDMGLGKTKITIDLFRIRKSLNQVEKMLILVPSATNVGTWEQELKKHGPEIKYKTFYNTNSLEELNENDDFDAYICTYKGFLHLVKKDGTKALDSEPKKLFFLGTFFEMVVYDESSKLKNHTATIFKSLKKFIKYEKTRKLTKNVKYRYALTGTPCGRDAQAFWSQFYLLDEGATLGTSLGIFREAFFNAKDKFWGGTAYTLQAGKGKLLNKFIRNKAIRYSDKECPDLPRVTHIVEEVIFGDEQWKFYSTLKEEAQKLLKNKEAKVSIIKGKFAKLFLDMRQISSGFITLKDEDSGEKVISTFSENPKLEKLEDLIDSLPEDKKIVIFHEYKKSGAIIHEMLNKKKIKHLWIYGETPDKIKRNAEKDFAEKKDIRIILGSSSLAYGVNLQKAHYCIFYEQFLKSEDQKQAEKRVPRLGREGGSDGIVFIYYLRVKNSIEEKIAGLIQQGTDLTDVLINEGNLLKNIFEE